MTGVQTLKKIEPAHEFAGWRFNVYFWSRSPQVLSIAAGIIVSIGLTVAWFASPLAPEAGQTSTREAAVSAELAKPRPDLGKILGILDGAAAFGTDRESFDEQVEESKLDNAGKLVLSARVHGIMWGLDEPAAGLFYYADCLHPLPFANELIGDFYAKGDEPDKAAPYYEREARFFDSAPARAKLVEILLDSKDIAGTRRIAADPVLLGSLTFEERIEMLSRLHRWRELARPMIAWEESLWKPEPVVVALVAGLGWLAIMLQAIQPRSAICFRTVMPVMAVLSGAASALLALFALCWQEQAMGLRESNNLFHGFAFFLLSVGPREELAKLICFLPFVPFLLARRRPLESFLIAGCVGLGFAINENLVYFAQTDPSIAFGRFLTSNFFHLSLTALSGLAFVEMLENPVKKTAPFLGTLLLLILAHGLYDALMPIVLFGFSISMIIFMVVALFFFRRLAVLRDSVTDQFSMAATFVAGVSVLAAVIVVAASMQLGFYRGLGCLVSSAFGIGMAAMMFYLQLTDGMQRAEFGNAKAGEPAR
jgi:RsiW-degrading membrane proteinase PrsW (M82 family)